MALIIGIDGGGSSLRVAVLDGDLTQLAQVESTTANPSAIGREAAAAHIQRTITAALEEAGVGAGEVKAAGVGVAGASDEYAAAWLESVLRPVLPAARPVLSSDHEIALVGGRGVRHGVLVLAGTGSIGYGVNTAGESLRVGGWGYLLGDEGSGYWLGMRALKAITRGADGRSEGTLLEGRVLEHLGLGSAQELIPWLYGAGSVPVRTVAALAPFVLEAAAGGDEAATQIVEVGAFELCGLARTIMQRLGLGPEDVVFSGGLLEAPNVLSLRLCRMLELPGLPRRRYPPVVGAALLAKWSVDGG